MEEKKLKKIFIIDGNSCMYKAFHAIPRLSSPEGLPTNAVYGFIQTLRKILGDFTPTHIAVAFDSKGHVFRHRLYEKYKAHRPPMPDSLSVQVPYIKDAVLAFDIAMLEMEGFEADDIIATLAKKAKAKGFGVVIVSGDKDLFQLVGESVSVLDHAKGILIGGHGVRERSGVDPAHIIDLIGLAGDASDGIPGIKGIGMKTAAKLINEYGSLEKVFEDIDSISNEKLKDTLRSGKDSAFLSKGLAVLNDALPFDFEPDGFVCKGPDLAALEGLFKALGFKKLIKELIPASAVQTLFRTIHGVDEFEAFIALLKTASLFSVYLHADDKGTSGMAFSMPSSTTAYLSFAGGFMSETLLVQRLKDIFEDKDIIKITDDAKKFYLWADRHGFRPEDFDFDTSIASYLLNPSINDHSIEAVAFEYVGIRLGREEQMLFERTDYSVGVPTQSVGRARFVLECREELLKRLHGQGLFELFTTIEMPLARVLADMELVGIKVDPDSLKGLSLELEEKIASLETTIYEKAGLRFNINSPKQLSWLLFEKMGIKPIRRTKTGFSTDEKVLTILAKGHELPVFLLDYRQLMKLKTTYVDSLSALINPETGRVHTSFNQTVTATGRLSSSNPNLQNIPISGCYADRIRETFIAEEGYIFLSADYSQVELRLAAHLSGDPLLIEAFERDEDIHAATAAKIFGVEPSAVTPEMRRKAKAVNFGIIYGMGPYGLSEDLGISKDEAVAYVDNYFLHLRGVKEFIGLTIEKAKISGCTETIFGRRRYVPELKAGDDATRRLGERIAVNTTVQGSAADIIKKAMISIHK
ncbi:MAG: DNA polymerase I, partial [Deltaproteobacteria bacterium]|nr:DNA polymerase I [Deltaproteobacteria bacterium]